MPDNIAYFGPVNFVLDERNYVETKPDPRDEERILNEMEVG